MNYVFFSFGFIGFVLDMIAANTDERIKKLYLFIASSGFWILYFISMDMKYVAIIYVLTVAVCFLFSEETRWSNLFFFLFLSLYFYLYFVYHFDFFIILYGVLFLISVWLKENTTSKKITILYSLIWIFYNFKTMAYIACFSELIYIVRTFINYTIYYNSGLTKEEYLKLKIKKKFF